MRYHTWPWRLLAHRAGSEERRAVNEAFVNTHPCCLDTWVSEPLRDQVRTAGGLEDPQLDLLRQELAKKLLLATNMHLESLLAHMKAAVPKGARAPNAEKFVYLAHVAQLFERHLSAGRRDRRGSMARDELLAMGVPMEHTAAASSAQRLDSRWRLSVLNAWIRQHPDSSAGERSAEAGRIARRWASMSAAEQRQAVAGLSSPNSTDAPEPADSSEEEQVDDYWEAGSSDWPIRADVLGSYLHNHFATQTARGVAGVAAKASKIRRYEVDSLLVHDRGDIAESTRFTYRFACGELHPGLCAHDDAAVYQNALVLAKSLEACLSAALLHSFLKIVDPAAEGKGPLFFYFARVRQRRFHAQVTHVLVACAEHHEDGVLSLSLGQRSFQLYDFWTLWKLAKTLLLDGYQSVRVVKLEHSSDSESTVRVGADGPSFDVWPNVWKRSRPPRHADLDAALAEGRQRRRRAVQRGRGGVIALRPSAALGQPPAPRAPGGPAQLAPPGQRQRVAPGDAAEEGSDAQAHHISEDDLDDSEERGSSSRVAAALAVAAASSSGSRQ